jgi:hypothetical protein
VPERTYTRPLLDKLGVKPGARVAVIDVEVHEFIEEVARRTADLTRGDARAGSDAIFFGADSVEELARLPALRLLIRPDGAIWVVSRKGKGASIRDVDVIEAAKSAGLVDNKVVSFSDTHTALRLVIPRASRPASSPPPSSSESAHSRDD